MNFAKLTFTFETCATRISFLIFCMKMKRILRHVLQLQMKNYARNLPTCQFFVTSLTAFSTVDRKVSMYRTTYFVHNFSSDGLFVIETTELSSTKRTMDFQLS